MPQLLGERAERVALGTHRAPRQDQGVEIERKPYRPTQTSELGLEKSHVPIGPVGDQHRAIENRQHAIARCPQRWERPPGARV